MHKIVLCEKCLKIISQCKCMSCNKTIEYTICDECRLTEQDVKNANMNQILRNIL
jgi:hypothetical protein